MTTTEQLGTTKTTRPLALLLRYAVLGAVALSILPASAAAFPAAAQDQPASNGDAKSKPPAGQPAPHENGPAGGGADDGLPASVNLAAFKGFLARAAKMSAAREIDLAGTRELRLEADIGEGGELGDPLIWLGRPASPALVDLSVEFVAALKESRVAGAVEGARHITLVLALDPDRVLFTARAEMDTERRAARAADGFGALLPLLRFRAGGRPAGVVWNNMTASASGKQLALRLEMTREAAGNLLLSQITPD